MADQTRPNVPATPHRSASWNEVYRKLLGSESAVREPSSPEPRVEWSKSSSPIVEADLRLSQTEDVSTALPAGPLVDPATELLTRYARAPSPSSRAIPETPGRLHRSESAMAVLSTSKHNTKLHRIYSPDYLKRSLSSSTMRARTLQPSFNSTLPSSGREKVARLISLADHMSKSETRADSHENQRIDSSPLNSPPPGSPSDDSDFDFKALDSLRRPIPADFDLSSDSLDLDEVDRHVRQTQTRSELGQPEPAQIAELGQISELGPKISFEIPPDLDSDSDLDLDELDSLVKQKPDFRMHEVQRRTVPTDEFADATAFSVLNRPHLRRYKVIGFHSTDSELTIEVVDDKNQPSVIICRGIWAQVEPPVGDIVHVVGQGPALSLPIVCDNSPESPVLVIRPDVLVTCTSIADSLECQRRIVLRDRLHTRFEPPNKYMLIGSIIHEIFQSCLRTGDFSQSNRHRLLLELVHETFAEDIFIADLDAVELIDDITARLSSLGEWKRLYFLPEPSRLSVVDDHRGNRNAQARSLLSISKVLDIEEEIWSPTYGLKGKIDVTVETVLKTATVCGRFVVPMEIKTSKSTHSAMHRAQTSLYTLLLKDRYNMDVPYGVLCYTQTNEMMRVPAFAAEVHQLITRRNEIALTSSLSSTTTLPPVIANDFACGHCRRLDTCMVYHKFTEDGTAETSGLGPKFNDMTESLTTSHRAFFVKWDTLINQEDAVGNNLMKQIWTMTSADREQLGLCYGRLKVKQDLDGALAESGGIFRYRLQRESPLPTGHESQLFSGDYIVVSDESGTVCLATGIFRGMSGDCDFDIEVNRILGGQFFDTTSVQDLKLRIDKNEVAFGMQLARNNLLSLFTKEGDSERRRLIVDLEPPQFHDQVPDYSLDQSSTFNSDQLGAIDRVMCAKDYQLILGMPGTGKTTTIAAIVKSLVAQGKSVLLAAFTNSAVDNIILKIRDQGFDILRIGSPQRTHEDVHDCLLSSWVKRALDQRLAKGLGNDQGGGNGHGQALSQALTAPVVGTTCYSTNHWVFSKRRFDYCIIDEASQLTLPACLGPLRLADRFVLVGDHYQLSPLVKSPEAAENGFGISLFKYLCEAHPQAVVNLSIQYRMCEDVMRLSNTLIYDGKLKCGDKAVASKSLAVPNPSGFSTHFKTPAPAWLNLVLSPSSRVLFLNTDAVSGAEEVSNGDTITNPGEADLTQAIVEALTVCGVSARSVGVITIYRAQLRLLRDRLNHHSGLEVLTADRFQGRDKDCVVISLVRSNATCTVGELLRDWRRLNVCFTRAESKLVVVGSRATLATAPALKEFLGLIDRQGWMYNLPTNALTALARPTTRAKRTPLSQTSSNKRLRREPVKHTAGMGILSSSPLLSEVVQSRMK